MQFIKFILSLVKWALTIFLTLLAIYILSSNFNIFGGYRPFLVQSGSMEPAIMTGDVIMVQGGASKYNLNDVITFHDSNGRTVTHRVIAVNANGNGKYSTKGDANRSGDEGEIALSQITGKVVLVIPRLGYFVSFSKTPTGLMVLVLLPAVFFALDELIKMLKNVKPRD